MKQGAVGDGKTPAVIGGAGSKLISLIAVYNTNRHTHLPVSLEIVPADAVGSGACTGLLRFRPQGAEEEKAPNEEVFHAAMFLKKRCVEPTGLHGDWRVPASAISE